MAAYAHILAPVNTMISLITYNEPGILPPTAAVVRRLGFDGIFVQVGVFVRLSR